MLHPGIASELSKLESEERRRDASERRAGRRAEHEWQPSAVGAGGLLALALLGPGVTILVLAAFVSGALLVAGRARNETPSAIGPEARDRWAAWRVVEPDAEYRRHAA
jgi:hypothetical protein